MKKLIQITIVSLLITTMLSSCGWRLRGSVDVANNISSVHISGLSKQNEFYRMLTRSLKANKVEIKDSHTEAQYRLVAMNQRSERRTATVSSSARVSEYQLTELVDIIIFSANGSQLIPRTTISTERFFDYDENDVQSKSEEAALLKREMLNDLVRQVINQLNAISNHPSSTSSENASEG